MPVIDIYICEINGKCGLIDANEKILLHAELTIYFLVAYIIIFRTQNIKYGRKMACSMVKFLPQNMTSVLKSGVILSAKEKISLD